MMRVAGSSVGSTTGSEATCLHIGTEELPLNFSPVPSFQMYLLPFINGLCFLCHFTVPLILSKLLWIILISGLSDVLL